MRRGAYLRRGASTKASPRCGVRNDNLNYRATLRVGMPFWTLRVLVRGRVITSGSQRLSSC
ncbi:hypothetical protein BVY12_14875 [Pseudomonas amygdali pv. morsprunorum]|nr:hypothetical protein BVY12_14875 [Pseudomonas amygdali pv. morsprunorum]